jgi:hypothetical protein
MQEGPPSLAGRPPDIDIAVADSLKVLDLKRPIRQADVRASGQHIRYGPKPGMAFGAPGAIDLRPIASDSMGMDMQRPNWKNHSWLPYCWAILIFSCSRVVVALGLVFSQKYLAIGRNPCRVCGVEDRRSSLTCRAEAMNP